MKIYNTQTRTKEEFVPLIPGKVSLYACGPTVYNYFHIGNARAFTFFDVVRRYLEWRGYEVTYVQNITDIDDKIIEQAIDEKTGFETVADKYTRAFLEDTMALGIKAPHHQPRATDVMQEIIALIDTLVQRGFAYEAGGDVYFDTQKLPDYGKLSGKTIEEQLPGARVAENLQKHHPADFTLWKGSKPGEPKWQSPWGEGRPGWHTECVVMGQKYLGESFDIHGGGVDLIFPHHENEQAQALALTGKPLARYWMHNGFLNIEGEKMSKSLNNFFTARDVLQEYDAEAIRFFFLSKHYRSPIDFNRDIIAESDKALKNFYQALRAVDYQNLPRSGVLDPGLENLKQEFINAMDDDFNTAKAVAVLFDLSHKARNAGLPTQQRQAAAQLLVELGSVLGFFQHLEHKLQEDIPNLSKALIELIVEYRAQARADKNWTLSDRIRDDLASLGIELKDTPAGITWNLKD
ncbi:MAG TPA: cysteine--tRNA ligase [Candidatus Cloacimonadota bacterium]|nr:cysteine--tRNA ligase [Candidatus Cloacimonadota bacterium]